MSMVRVLYRELYTSNHVSPTSREVQPIGDKLAQSRKASMHSGSDRYYPSQRRTINHRTQAVRRWCMLDGSHHARGTVYAAQHFLSALTVNAPHLCIFIFIFCALHAHAKRKKATCVDGELAILYQLELSNLVKLACVFASFCPVADLLVQHG
jgi:hypothetical protein